MPKATVDTNPQRKDLKSLKEGYVILKALPYGPYLKRRDNAMRMSMEGNRDQSDSNNNKIDLEMMQYATRIYEFEKCIVDHNLEDDQGNKLDFANPMTLDVLDPKIGQEIEQLIDQINGDETPEPDFTSASTQSSPKAIVESNPK